MDSSFQDGVHFIVFDIKFAVTCPFLTQGLRFRMCNMRGASAPNLNTSLLRSPLSQEKITDKFMASKMLSAGARADARNNLVEIIETNCRGLWYVVPNWLRHSKTNRLYRSHPQIRQMERVPTVGTTELRNISRTIHITRNWIGWNS